MVDRDDDDPLTVELATLRTAVAQFQQEAHTSALRLQRHVLSNANVLERNKSLEQENSRLRAELVVLRANPVSTPQPAAHQVQELTLALRRVSDKVTFTEDALSACRRQLAHTRSDLVKAKHSADGAFALAAAARAREEERRVREQDLRHCLRVAEHDRKMSDQVVQEYADLVRSMESRTISRRNSVGSNASSPTNSSSVTLFDSLTDAKSESHKLLEACKMESNTRETEIACLEEELRLCQNCLASEREASAHDRSELSNALVELERLKIDDKTAAKMVARYMKFSQSTATSLQSSLTALTSRHAATQATLLAELDDMRGLLTRESQDTSRLRNALDEMSADLAREVYGRRREVSLRLSLLGREERICERLSRWIRRSRELASRAKTADDTCECHSCRVFEDVLADAHKMLEAVDGESVNGLQSSGQLSRLMVAEDTVKRLTKELTSETERRLRLDITVAQTRPNGDHVEPLSRANDLVERNQEISPQSEPSNTDNAQTGTFPLTSLNEDSEEPAPLPTPPLELHDPLRVLDTREHIPLNKPTSENQSQPATPHTDSESGIPSHYPDPTQTVPQEPVKLTLSVPPATDTSPYLPHPLLGDLERVSKRYDDLQRALRDCHLALQDLKSNMSDASNYHPTPENHHVNAVLQTAIERLYNYTEDARVELEIRVADEALLARGFEALLSIPGAMSPSPSSSSVSVNEYSPRPESQDLEAEIQAFVDGTEASVRKALRGFNARLEDIQHDIAVVKLATHNLRSPVFGEPIETLRTSRILDLGHAELHGDPMTNQDQKDIDPFANLGLRVPMPRYVHKPSRQQKAQSRKSSGMHMLGLGLPYRVSEAENTSVEKRVWSMGISLAPAEGSSRSRVDDRSKPNGYLEVE